MFWISSFVKETVIVEQEMWGREMKKRRDLYIYGKGWILCMLCIVHTPMCTNASLVKYKYRVTLVAPCKPFIFGISLTEQLLISYQWCQVIEPGVLSAEFCNVEVG